MAKKKGVVFRTIRRFPQIFIVTRATHTKLFIIVSVHDIIINTDRTTVLLLHSYGPSSMEMFDLHVRQYTKRQ